MKAYGYYRPAPEQRILTADDLHFWLIWLEEYTDEQIRAIDRALCRHVDEVEGFGLSSLPRVEMARIMRAAELHLTARKTVDRYAPTAYGLKHKLERYIALSEGRCYYVSELQCKAIMHILGYRAEGYPGRYNVSMRSYNAFCTHIDMLARAYGNVCA